MANTSLNPFADIDTDLDERIDLEALKDAANKSGYQPAGWAKEAKSSSDPKPKKKKTASKSKARQKKKPKSNPKPEQVMLRRRRAPAPFTRHTAMRLEPRHYNALVQFAEDNHLLMREAFGQAVEKLVGKIPESPKK